MIRTALLACVLLAGCADAPLALSSPPPQPFDRLAAVSVERSTDLAVLPGAVRLDAAPRAALATFRSAQGTVHGDRYTVMAAAPLDPRLALVSEALGGSVLQASHAALPPGVIRVVLNRVVVTVAACPDWSRSSVEDFSNRTFSNYGCADAVNLAAQVADPHDLTLGRGGDAEAQPLADAVARYRRDKVKPLSTGGDLPFAVAAPVAAPAP